MSKFLVEVCSFAAVVEHGGFSAAARATGQSKASLSQQVSRLEQRLDTQLLYRSTRRVSLTKSGEVLIDYARRILNAEGEAVDALNALGTDPSGTVSVTMPVSFGEIFMTEVATSFRELYPAIRLRIELENEYRDLKETGADIAIRKGLMNDPDQVAIPLGRYSEIVCAAPSYLASHGMPETPDALKGHLCLVNEHTARDSRWTFYDGADAMSVAVTGPLLVNHFPLIRTAAVNGYGIARLPRYLAMPDVTAGALVPILTRYASPIDPVYLVYIREARLPRRTRLFVDHVRDWFRARPELLSDGSVR